MWGWTRTKEIGWFVGAVLLASVGLAKSDAATFTLNNQSDFVVFEVVVSPDYDRGAVANLLDSSVVGPGEQRQFHMEAWGSHCIFNVVIRATNGLFRVFNDRDLCEDTYMLFDAGRAFVVSNESRTTIAAVQASPDFGEEMGPNRLREEEVIDPGGSRIVTLEERRYNNRCEFDIRLITISAIADYQDRDLCDDMMIVFFEGNEVTVANDGRAVVRSVRVSLDHESQGWGDELLEDSLPPGESLTTRLHQFPEDQCLFDVLIEDEREHVYAQFDVCRTARLAHSPDAGDGPLSAPVFAAEDPAVGKPAGHEFSDCDGCPWMVVVEGGAFERGSWERDDEAPVTNVTVPGPFAVGQFEVSVGQFEEFARDTGHDGGSDCQVKRAGWARLTERRGAGRTEGRNWRNPGFNQDDAHPVVCVSWNDAVAYTRWLAEKAGRPYRLLTEAEAELLARASATNFKQSGRANCRDCGSRWDGKSTSPVGRLRPDKLGLSGVFGNAAEWVQDCYQSGYSNAPRDGSAWSSPSCERRVVRGGCWSTSAQELRASGRDSDDAGSRSGCVGLRVARGIEL